MFFFRVFGRVYISYWEEGFVERIFWVFFIFIVLEFLKWGLEIWSFRNILREFFCKFKLTVIGLKMFK